MLTIRPAPSPPPPPPATDLYVCPFTVIVDSREQTPFSFSGLTLANSTVIVKRERAALATGDYSIKLLEGRVAIERKSPKDLVGSVCGGHARFEREHERMLAMVESGGRVALVCEGSYSAIDDALRADGRWKAAETLLGTVASWPSKFAVPWFFAGDRRRAEILTFRLLLKWYGWIERERAAAESPKSP